MTTASTGEKKLVFINDNFGGHFWENGTYHNPASCSVCIAKQANSIPPHKELCPNCGGDIAIRNPTGHCDHLYYPENVPHKKHKNWENEFDRYFLDINAFVATDHSPFPCSSKVFDGKIAVKCFISQLLLSTQQEAVEEALAQRDDALIKKIKGMMKEVNDNSNIGEDTEFAYNQALYDVLSHLQETEGKV